MGKSFRHSCPCGKIIGKPFRHSCPCGKTIGKSFRHSCPCGKTMGRSFRHSCPCGKIIGQPFRHSCPCGKTMGKSFRHSCPCVSPTQGQYDCRNNRGPGPLLFRSSGVSVSAGRPTLMPSRGWVGCRKGGGSSFTGLDGRGLPALRGVPGRRKNRGPGPLLFRHSVGRCRHLGYDWL